MIKKKPRKQDYASIPLLRDAFFEHTRYYSSWGSEYTVTDLIKPPRIVHLGKRYKEVIDSMPIDHDFIEKNISSFKGTAIHNHFEKMLYRYISKNTQVNYLIERRIWDRICDRKISGKFDCWLNSALYDVKTTSVWKRVFGDFTEWEQQLNIYAYLLGTCGIPVKILYILAWYLDWEKWKVFDPEYPKNEIELIHIDTLWTPRVAEEYTKGRIEVMKQNENRLDDDLEPCTEKEMWVKPEKWAVYKVTKNNPDTLPQKASRVLDSEAAAQKWANRNQKKLKSNEMFRIIFRPGERTRCVNFCHVAPFCNIYHQHMAEQEGSNAPETENDNPEE